MTARQLYEEVRRRFPDASDIFTCSSCQDSASGRVLDTWSVLVYSVKDGEKVLAHKGFGLTPEECLKDIKEVTHERHEG